MTIVRRRALHRTTDPDTSKSAVPAASDRRAFMARLLEEFKKADLTAEEAADRAGLDRWQASKRVSDLKQVRCIEPTGEKRRGQSGRLQQVHRVTARGEAGLL